MKYRLVALDMDGTLLTPDKSVTPRTEEVIRRAVKSGVHICLSTGRPLCGVRRYVDQLELTAPAITCNGAAVVEPVTGRIVYRQDLALETVRTIWRLGRRFGTTIVLWSGDRLYVSEINERTEDYKKISGVEPQVIADPDFLAGEGISKMLWYDTPQSIDRFRAMMDEEGGVPGAVYVTSNPAFLEFVDSRVSKAAALERLGEYLGIPREEIMAVGDGENDLSMLRYAGLGVAMANAAQSVREQCDYVTLSNREDGVAAAIEKFCL